MICAVGYENANTRSAVIARHSRAQNGRRLLQLVPLTGDSIPDDVNRARSPRQGRGVHGSTGKPVDANGDGRSRLVHVGDNGLRKLDRRVARRALAGPPVAVHARRDDRAARPVFLHIGRGAAPHRIRAGIVARIDIGFPLVLPVDRHAAERPPALCGRVGGGRLRLPARCAPLTAPSGPVRPHPATRIRSKSPLPPPSQSASFRPPKACYRAVRSPIAAPRSTGRCIQDQ